MPRIDATEAINAFRAAAEAIKQFGEAIRPYIEKLQEEKRKKL